MLVPCKKYIDPLKIGRIFTYQQFRAYVWDLFIVDMEGNKARHFTLSDRRFVLNQSASLVCSQFIIAIRSVN